MISTPAGQEDDVGRAPQSAAPPERVLVLRPRSVLAGLGVVLGVVVAVGFVLLARAGLTLIAIALFLSLALNPAVVFFRRRGLRHGAAVGGGDVLAAVVLAFVRLLLLPP